jgi:hypothetical protein
VQALFDATHEIDTGGMAAVCRLVRLPDAGGASEQDAWLLDALEVLRDESNAMLAEARKRA